MIRSVNRCENVNTKKIQMHKNIWKNLSAISPKLLSLKPYFKKINYWLPRIIISIEYWEHILRNCFEFLKQVDIQNTFISNQICTPCDRKLAVSKCKKFNKINMNISTEFVRNYYIQSDCFQNNSDVINPFSSKFL